MRSAKRQIRNMLATLLLSQGTPMLLAGDEFGRTQAGNNNAYCQDNEISWLNWDIGKKGHSLIQVHAGTDRAASPLPDPAPRPLHDGRDRCGIRRQGRDLAQRLGQGDVQRRTGRTAVCAASAMLLDGRARATGNPPRLQRRQHADGAELASFRRRPSSCRPSPEAPSGASCSTPTRRNHEEEFTVGDEYMVTGRSVLLFERVAALPQRERRRAAVVVKPVRPARPAPAKPAG